MAHGRKRSFIAGVVAGMALTITGSFALIYGLDITFGPPGFPAFSETSARAATIEWARLSPFPAAMQSFTIVTSGSMFSREFRVSFFGEPRAIAAWVRSCPGISDPKTASTPSPDGGVTFAIPAGGGAMFAELVHYIQPEAPCRYALAGTSDSGGRFVWHLSCQRTYLLVLRTPIPFV